MALIELKHVVGGYGGYLYIGFAGPDGLELWRSATGAAGDWLPANVPGFGDANNRSVLADGATEHAGAFYLAASNRATGVQVWRTSDGQTWAPVVVDGWGDARTAAAQLGSFNDHLYVWAANYDTGQKVYRARCGPPP